MRMLWWFIVLGVSVGLALGAALAMYFRVRRQMRGSEDSLRETLNQIETARQVKTT